MNKFEKEIIWPGDPDAPWDPTEQKWEIPLKKRRINISLTPYAIMELRARSENNGMTLSGYLEWLAHQPPKEVKK